MLMLIMVALVWKTMWWMLMLLLVAVVNVVLVCVSVIVGCVLTNSLNGCVIVVGWISRLLKLMELVWLVWVVESVLLIQSLWLGVASVVGLSCESY